MYWQEHAAQKKEANDNGLPVVASLPNIPKPYFSG
jgi:hypothetical protein